MNASKIAIVLAHALTGWALCAATMGIGMAVVSLDQALIIHAILAPVFFAGVSLIYFSRFHFTTPLQTAAIFLGVVVAMDVVVVAGLINHSFGMFGSLLGTWIPFGLIFLSTYLTGSLVVKRGKSAPVPR
jgi:hypothetical protein